MPFKMLFLFYPSLTHLSRSIACMLRLFSIAQDNRMPLCLLVCVYVPFILFASESTEDVRCQPQAER